MFVRWGNIWKMWEHQKEKVKTDTVQASHFTKQGTVTDALLGVYVIKQKGIAELK